MSLYKYVSSERIDVLENGMIRFTQPDAFNDPFEMKPHIQSLASEAFAEKHFNDGLENILKELYEEEIEKNVKKLKGQVPHNVSSQQIEEKLREIITFDCVQAFAEHKLPEVEEQFKTLIQSPSLTKTLESSLNSAFNKSLGILSLTEKKDNLLMWSHYADSHKGFVIEWDKNNPFFDQRTQPKDDFRYLRKVSYSHIRPQVKLAEMKSFEPFFTKSKEWEYEQEWRMSMSLSCSHKKIPNKHHDIHLFEFPKNSIRSITFGCRMSEENQEKLREILNNLPDYSGIKLFQTTIAENEFKLSFEEVK